jgi:uncharacterized repeat protein (TIGR03803 family)
MLGTRTYPIAIALLAMLVTAVTTPSHAQTLSSLYAFGDNIAFPIGALAQGEDGALYGMGESTGGISGPYQGGGIYKITPAGTEKPLSVGVGPTGVEAIIDASPTGDVTTLFTFTGGADGANVQAPPIEGPDGSFYGVATNGGGSSGCGTIFRMTQAGFTLLYQFDKLHGCNPAASMVLGTDGNLYGTTVNGGTAGGGVVFQLKLRPGKSAIVTVLANFDETNRYPRGALVQGNDGNFYGTTSGQLTLFPAASGPGTGMVFKVTASGTLTVLHTLNGTTDGTNPLTGMVQATDGNFYGTASFMGVVNENAFDTCVEGCGTLFQVTPEGSYTVLATFYAQPGDYPLTTPIQHTNGLLYGTTWLGDFTCDDLLIGCGSFYSWDANLPPFVKTVQLMGPVGTIVEILGQGFNSSSTVTFNGTAAEVNLQSATSLWTKVPAGATTGLVTVTTSSGPLNSNRNFIVTP